MPAAAVANLTPSIGGMSGNCAGASGEVGVDKALSPTACPGLSNRTTALLEVRTYERRKSDAAIEAEIQFRSVLLLLGRLVEALDLGGLPQFRDELSLRLAREKCLDLTLHFFEFRRLFGAFE